MKTYIIKVRPLTEDLGLDLMSKLTRTFTSKEHAKRHSDYLINLGWNIININTDTYVDGFCVKNEFSKYDGVTNNTYSVVDYSKKKKTAIKKLTKEQKISMFFDL